MIVLLLALGMTLLYGLRYVMTTTTNVVIDGTTYTNVQTTAAPGQLQESVSVPAAKVGQLTTRTDSTHGTLTMAAGHGFTTGAVISLFWVGGQVTTVTCGTVSVNSVPITLSAGTLPANLTNITAMIPTSMTYVLTGNNVQGLVLNCQGTSGFVTLSQSGGTVITSFSLVADGSQSPNYNYNWSVNNGITNPVSGGAVGLVLFSHGDSAAAHTMFAGALYNL